MAAKKRKPAITGMARPEGIQDDIIRPVMRALTKSPAKKAAIDTKQYASYRKKAMEKMGRAAERDGGDFMNSRRGRRDFVSGYRELEKADMSRAMLYRRGTDATRERQSIIRHKGKVGARTAKDMLKQGRSLTRGERFNEGLWLDDAKTIRKQGGFPSYTGGSNYGADAMRMSPNYYGDKAKVAAKNAKKAAKTAKKAARNYKKGAR